MNSWLKFPNWIYIIIQIFILGCLSLNLRAHNFLRKFGLIEEFKRRFDKKIKELRNQRSAISKFISEEREMWFKTKFGLDFVRPNILTLYDIPIKFFGNKKILLIFSLATFLSIFYTISDIFILSAFSFILGFFILTMIALAYGFGDAYYPPSILVTKDGKEIRGNIIKFSDDFIFVLSGEEKFFVNKDNIAIVKQSLWKEIKK